MEMQNVDTISSGIAKAITQKFEIDEGELKSLILQYFTTSVPVTLKPKEPTPRVDAAKPESVTKAKPAAPKAASTKSVVTANKITCSGFTKTGNPCNNKVKNPGDLCTTHKNGVPVSPETVEQPKQQVVATATTAQPEQTVTVKSNPESVAKTGPYKALSKQKKAPMVLTSNIKIDHVSNEGHYFQCMAIPGTGKYKVYGSRRDTKSNYTPNLTEEEYKYILEHPELYELDASVETPDDETADVNETDLNI